MVKKIAVLTSGGDAPGMNAAVRATIRAGLSSGCEMYVVYNGFRGLYEGDIHQVNKDFTQDIINRGGTILRSSRFPEFKNDECKFRDCKHIKEVGCAVINDVLEENILPSRYESYRKMVDDENYNFIPKK